MSHMTDTIKTHQFIGIVSVFIVDQFRIAGHFCQSVRYCKGAGLRHHVLEDFLNVFRIYGFVRTDDREVLEQRQYC